MSRFLNIPEGTGDFERLRLIYKSLVDECKDSNALLASVSAQLDAKHAEAQGWIDAKHALLRQLEEKDRRIASLEAKLAREAEPAAAPTPQEPDLFT